MTFNIFLNNRTERVNQALTNSLPSTEQEPKRLHSAMRYAVLNGGKRIRPLLVYAVGETFGANPKQLDIPACAVEFIHSFSLIHDDLPAMDDDNFRRGRLACHKAFDEAIAILAGDSLANLAFKILSRPNDKDNNRLKMISVLSEANSSFGMGGGQALDLACENKKITVEELENMHILKTGALIRASVKLGVLAAGSATTQQMENLDQYAKTMGLAFQIQDDILDAGDSASNKTNYVSLLGMAESQKKLAELQTEILQYLQALNIDCPLIIDLTRHIMQRKN